MIRIKMMLKTHMGSHIEGKKKRKKKKQNKIRLINTNLKPLIDTAHQNRNTNYKVP
jgi:uncharacterized protein Veg